MYGFIHVLVHEVKDAHKVFLNLGLTVKDSVSKLKFPSPSLYLKCISYAKKTILKS